MSDNLSFFRSSYFRSEEAGSVDPDLVKPLPDQPGSVVVRVRYVRTNPVFQSIFSSLKSGNEVSLTLIINDGTLE